MSLAGVIQGIAIFSAVSLLFTAALSYRVTVIRRRFRVLKMLGAFDNGASVQTISYHPEMKEIRRHIKGDLEWWTRKGVTRRKTYGHPFQVVVYLIKQQGE